MPRTVPIGLIALLSIAISACAPLAQQQPVATARPTPEALIVEHPPPTPSPTPVATPTPAATPAPTLPPGFTIAMPVYRQVMNLDCETAALQMGLAALGHYFTQPVLFAPQNPDNTKPVMKPGTKIVLQWGNPYKQFVGDVNGSDLAPSGYGVYWPPIVAIAQSHGAPDSVGREGFSPPDIYAALQNHHPVLVWVETGWENARAAGYTGVWTSWDNQPIRYSLIEHVVTLSGVSDTQVRVNDPWKSGSQYWYPKRAFEASWADFNNMAVILQ